jgi:selenocysteine lyase/cysteine desulfurase
MGCAASSTTAGDDPQKQSAEISQISNKIQEIESLLLTNKLRFAQCVKQKNIEGARAITAHNTGLRKDLIALTKKLNALEGVRPTAQKASQCDIVSSTMSEQQPTVVSPAEQDQNPL